MQRCFEFFIRGINQPFSVCSEQQNQSVVIVFFYCNMDDILIGHIFHIDVRTYKYICKKKLLTSTNHVRFRNELINFDSKMSFNTQARGYYIKKN